MVQLVKILSNNSAAKSTTYLGDDGQTYVLTGDLAQRANNPGNISPTGTRGLYESQFGAIGYLPSSPGQPAVAVFPTLDAGTQAQQYLWSTPAYQNKTIAQAAASWASAPYTSQLASAAGVSPDTKISDLSPQQMSALFSAQNTAEGSSNLRVADASGNPLPASVIRGGSAIDAANALAGAPTNPALAYALNSPMASLYGAPPSPLSPPKVPDTPPFLPNGNSWAVGSPAATYYDPSNPAPAQHLTDMNAPVGGLPPPNLPLDLPAYTPPLPIPRPVPPIMPSTAGVPAPHLVTLNGKQVPVGTYASPSNPGSTFTVADDGTGKAVVTNNDPGFMNVAKMGQGTVAGGVVGKAIGGAATQAEDNIGQAASNVGASASQLGSIIAGLGGNLLSGLGGLFNRQPSTPAFLPSGNSWKMPSPPANIPSPVSSSAAYPGDLSSGGLPAPIAPPVPKALPAQSTALPSFMPSGSSWATPYNTVPPPAPLPPSAIPPAPPAPPVVPQSIGAVVPPVPFGNPSWLAPVMPQSALFANNPIAQAVQQSKYGSAAQFLSGSQNNYSYLQPAANKMGIPAASLHAALMAQQNKAQGGPVGSPSNFGSSYFETAF